MPLDPPAATVAALASLLAPGERDRADRFRFDRHRRRYQVAHAALRLILATHADRARGELPLAAGPHGKPHLEGPLRWLRFNLSHTADLALIACARDIELGVDIERTPTDDDLRGAAARYFSPAERAELAALPPALAPGGFCRAWTRKEAFIKAIGLGLHMALDAFDVSLDPRTPATLRAVRDPAYPAAAWHLRDLPIDRDHAAALVLASPARIDRLRLQW